MGVGIHHSEQEIDRKGDRDDIIQNTDGEKWGMDDTSQKKEQREIGAGTISVRK
jgi:hypothetical protein